MLRAEVAMLQLTVAEAIGMGPRGREYGLIRAAAATSDDEGSGAAPAPQTQPGLGHLRQHFLLCSWGGVQCKRRVTETQVPYPFSKLP